MGDLGLLVGEHLVEGDDMRLGEGVNVDVGGGPGEASKQFVFPSQEKVLLFVVKGDILHVERNLKYCVGLFRLIFKYTPANHHPNN